MGPYGTDNTDVRIDYEEITNARMTLQTEIYLNSRTPFTEATIQNLRQLSEFNQIDEPVNGVVYWDGVGFASVRPVNVTQGREVRATMSKDEKEKAWLDEVGKTGIPPSSAIRMFMAEDDTLEFWAGTTIATLKDNVLKVKKSKGKHLLSRFKKLARKEGWELAVLNPNVDHTGEVMELLFLSVTDIPEMDDSNLVSTVKVYEPVPQRHLGTNIIWNLEETPF